MARPRTPRTLEVIAACREHLLIDGPTDWGPLASKFPDVPRSTFFKCVEAAKMEIEKAAITQQSPLALREAQRRLRARVEAPEVTERRVKAHLPTAPSPAVIASMGGAEQRQLFDFMGFFHKIVRDADMLRNKAVVVNEDGTERLVNPMLLNASMRTRLSVLDTWLSAMNEFYNLEKLQELYKLIIDEVGKADPEAQQAILARLRQLNNERGLTMAARL